MNDPKLIEQINAPPFRFNRQVQIHFVSEMHLALNIFFADENIHIVH